MRVIASLGVLLVVSACSVLVPPARPVSHDASAATSRSTFIVAGPRGIVALDEDCREIGRIVELPPLSTPATPALSGDGGRITFTLTQPPSTMNTIGSDIYEVGVDGTGLRRLIEHEANVFYSSPIYDPAGDAIYVHRRAPVISGGRYVANTDDVLRIDLRTGERRMVATGVLDPAVSPDGKRIAYLQSREGSYRLWTADLPTGANARPLLPAGEEFYYAQAPRFSAKGDRIVFSAARRAAGGSLASGRAAHLGIPSDLFVVRLDGAGLTSLATTTDDVVPAWSPDGTRIAYVGALQFAIVTVAGGSTRVCAGGEQFAGGFPLWLR